MNAQSKSHLIEWYRQNKRSLPWRSSQDPYAIWISEMMCQQTTVRVVIPYYERFLKSFPTVQALAKAKEEKVLSLWSGLGYYSRARNIHKAAKEIVKLENFPNSYEELLKLPGIGPYSAAAISSIAFNEPVACIDGNVIRVVSRLFDISENIISREGKSLITKHANDLMIGQPPSLHNQAMMELGATICTPQNPSCLLCPLSKVCLSRKNETIEQRPVKNKKRAQEPWLWTLYFVEQKGRIALVKNDNGAPWLKNTWVLPGHAKPLGKNIKIKPDFKHSITHHKIFVKLVDKQASQIKDFSKVCWVLPKELNKMGLSSVVLKALQHRNEDSP